jgi:hypothetical protein
MREWQYWTRNKLSILAGYLPAFNVASKKSPQRLSIDLMAGEPFNRDAQTGEEFDGSARLALSCAPPFTRIALCEMPQKAAALEKDLHARYPGRSFKTPNTFPLRLPRDASMLYDIERVDSSGRVASNDIITALHWRPGIKLDIILTRERSSSARHRRAGDRVSAVRCPLWTR